MLSNVEKYQNDLESLIVRGGDLYNAMQYECYPEEYRKVIKDMEGIDEDEFIKLLPVFSDAYQGWYSESQSVIKQLLPDRLVDFVSYYKKPTSRKNITFESYRIEDYLQNLVVSRGGEKVVGKDAAIPHLRQQFMILKSVRARFESSLFDIRQLVQADIFDSELEAAHELAKHNYTRAAGALSGVVLERHLSQVCDNHNIKISKKNPSIADYNDTLKSESTIDIPQWRFIQHLADIRNLCDHNKKLEPTVEQVDDLLAGVAKVIKTIF